MISTMKVTLLFALFGLSFYVAIADATCSGKVSYSDQPDCPILAVQKSAETAYAYGYFVCSYNESAQPGTSNYAAFQDASAKFVELMKCIGCSLSSYWVNGITLEEMFAEIAEGVVGIEDTVVKFKNAVGLGAASDAAFCILIGDILTSECLKKLLADDLAGLIKDLEDVIFKLNEGATSDAADKFVDILIKAKCIVDGKLQAGGTLQDLLKTIGLAFTGVVEKLHCAAQKLFFNDEFVDRLILNCGYWFS